MSSTPCCVLCIVQFMLACPVAYVPGHNLELNFRLCSSALLQWKAAMQYNSDIFRHTLHVHTQGPDASRVQRAMQHKLKSPAVTFCRFVSWAVCLACLTSDNFKSPLRGCKFPRFAMLKHCTHALGIFAQPKRNEAAGPTGIVSSLRVLSSMESEDALALCRKMPSNS